ncbi:hypothetical protein HELRODRAFT_168829 [Helobdella robusta]|uniref:PABS domain-containing protein n=1 Tax=Helobdella robusta TaxID=6412 RepID=T1F106_HELRO|nr:hypothetical protein HELRODRAFT_168829 [Helobdella robusta]ESO08910.1 hypothetical protein HELRODRAFT_168829 [Helobdella robusta]
MDKSKLENSETKRDEIVLPYTLSTSSAIYNGWFMECIDASCPGQAFCLKVDPNPVTCLKSDYQDIKVLKSESYGNVLVLDGIINCTERDECSYQEMMTHLAMCSHKNPKKVLIIGGGDGGIAREAAKHACVQRVDQCEIDEKVVDVCRDHLESMSRGYDNDKVDLHIGDGFVFLKERKQEYDVIITDSSDPIGPAEVLFGLEYYKLLYESLKSGGIIVSQGESLWIDGGMDYMPELIKEISSIFPSVDYAYTYIPSYTTGQIGFILASKDEGTNFRKPVRILSDVEKSSMNLQYYSEKVHESSFVFPRFIQKVLDQCLNRN